MSDFDWVVYNENLENMPFKEREELALKWLTRDYLGVSSDRYEEYKSYMDWYEENRGREDYLSFPKMLRLYFSRVNLLKNSDKIELRALFDVWG